MATFRGIEVGSVEFVHQRDLYLVRGIDGELLGELSSIAFHSLPQLRQVPHGRYRRAASKAQGYPAQPSSRANTRTVNVPWPTFTTFTWPSPIPKPKPRPVENAGIRAGEIRAWLLGRNRLHSVYIDSHFWPPGMPVTGDVASDLGVHAFKSRAWAEHYTFMKRVFEDQMENVFLHFCCEQPPPKYYVIGTVDLWGDVIEHQRGYRAEFAQIATLDEIVGGADQSALDQLRADYCAARAA